MTEDEYLNQDVFYFSESQSQLVRIDSMPPPYALNAMRKLHEYFGDKFLGTPLHAAFMAKIIPRSDAIRRSLLEYGKAVVWVGSGGLLQSAARSRLRRAGAKKIRREGEFMVGVFDTGGFTVNLKPRRR